MNTTLKKLTDKQLAPLLVESEHAFLASKKHPYETSLTLVEKFKSDERYEVFGYILEGVAVSYIIALSGRTETEIAIGPMYVAKVARGKGLGKQQVADFIRVFSERDYSTVFTKTWLGNAASRHVFESLGFIEIGRKENDRVGDDITLSYALHIADLV